MPIRQPCFLTICCHCCCHFFGCLVIINCDCWNFQSFLFQVTICMANERLGQQVEVSFLAQQDFQTFSSSSKLQIQICISKYRKILRHFYFFQIVQIQMYFSTRWLSTYKKALSTIALCQVGDSTPTQEIDMLWKIGWKQSNAQKMWNLYGVRFRFRDSRQGWTIPAELSHTGNV